MNNKEALIGGKGGGSSFKNTPDNLRSTDTFEALIGLCSGRIKGLAPGGLQNLKIDDVPIQDSSGNSNLKDFAAVLFDGDPSVLQPIQLQLGGSSGPHNVNLAVNNPNTDNVTPGDWRNGVVTEVGVDYIDIRLVVNALYRQDKNGIYDTTARIEVQFQPSGSSTWMNVLTNNTAPTYNQDGTNLAGTFLKMFLTGEFYNGSSTWNDANPGYITLNGKTTSAYVKELRVAVPNTGAWANKTWNVRLRLLERDTYVNGQDEEHRTIVWESVAGAYTKALGDREEWRGLAYLHVNGKASDQLSGIPNITGVYDLTMCRVPPASVWNAATRVYTGATWDGVTEELQWTQCPAFQMKDLVEDSISGISALAPGSTMNKWDVLDASKWFAQLVPDGQGGQQPRYSMNYILDQSLSVNDLMQYVAGAVGAFAWDEGDGTWRLLADKPENAVAIFTKENVVGEFNYSHTDIDTRYNDITGVFKDETNGFKETRVRVFDQDHIDTYGQTHTSVVLVGCTNRQEALRRTKLRQLISLNETRMVSFTTNRQGRQITPFNVIMIADQDLGTTGVRSTGRLIGNSGTTLTLRDPVRLEVGVTYTVDLTIPNPNYNPDTTTQPTNVDWRKPTITITRNITNTSAQRGDVTTLYIDTALPAGTPTNAPIALDATGLPSIPKQYRVLSVEPQDDGELVNINAIEIYTNKWNESDAVDEGEILSQVSNRDIPAPTAPVGGMFKVTSFSGEFGTTRRLLNVSWVRPASLWIDGFKVEYNLNSGPWTTFSEKTQDNFVELAQPVNGVYNFRITTLDRRGGNSLPLLGTYTLTDVATDYAPQALRGPLSGRPVSGNRNGDSYTTTDQNPNTRYVWSGNAWNVDTNYVSTADQITYTSGPGTQTVDSLKPAEAGADITGTHTANDTANVGGIPSATVLANIAAAQNDFTPPNVPTGLAVTSNLTNDPVTGQPIITLVATCTASTAPDIGSYDFAVQQGSGSFIEFTVISPRLELKVPANTGFTVKVRATDKSGNPSGYSTTVAHTTVKDTTAPAVPTGLAVTQGYTSLWLNWTNPSDIDLASIEVWENTTNNSGTASKIATVSVEAGSPGSYSRVGLTTGGQRFYWLKAVDTSNNVSGFSTGANGTPGAVAVGDLSGFITADQIAAGFGSAGSNLVLNGNAEGGTAPATPGWKLGAFTSAGSTFVSSAGDGVNGGNAFTAVKTATGNQSSGRSRAIPVKQSTPYNVRVQAHADTATTAGFYLRIYYFTAVDAAGYGTTTVGSTTDLTGASNGPLGTTWTQFDQTVTSVSGARYMAIELINYSTSTALTMYLDDVEVREQLTAGQVGSGFVTGTMLAAGAIDITKFATGLAPVEKLSALPSTGNFEGRQVYLTTDKKVYRWTDTSTTGTTFWSKQTDGADIKANSIVAGSFVAGSIQAADIAAKSITADRLLIGDAANQIRDPEYRSLGAVGAGTFWQQSSGGTVAPSTTVSTDTNVTGTMLLARALKFDLTGSTTGSFNNISTTTTNFIPVQPGAAYRFICQALIKAGWNGRISCDLQWYTAAGAYTGVTDTMSWGNYNNAPAATDVAYANGTMSSSSAPGKQYIVAPANGSFLSITIKNSNASTTPAGVAYVGDPFLNRMADGQLVVDGSITATAIATNTITAQNLVLATRGITVSGIEFTHNSGGTTNLLGWTAGSINYVDNSGTVQTVSISAGTGAWSSGTLYVYWTQGSTTLSVTTSAATALNSNVALMATYLGGTNLIATYGRTIIDGSKIYAGTIGAAQISAGAISTSQLAVGLFGGNLVSNPGAEAGTTDGWVVDPAFNTAGGVFSASNADKNAGSYSFLLSKTATGNQLGVDTKAMPVTPGKTYALRWYEKGSSATASGWYMRLHQAATYPTSGFVSSGVAASYTDVIGNGAIAAAWTLREFTYTAPAGVYWVSMTPINYINGPLSIWLDDFQFIEQNTTTMIANGAIVTNHIAVGTLNGDRIQTNTLDATAIKAGSVLAGTITVGGTALSTAVSNAANGQTAFTGTANYRTTGAPSNNPVPSAITITDNTNGTRDIQVNWNAYTQGANKADFLILFWNKTSTAPTINDASVSFSVNTSGGSYYRFEGVNPAQAYSFGIAAARRTENGLEIGTIVAPTSAPQWVNVASGTPNFTANVGGTSAATVVANAALGAQDPGTRINAASTQIDPGKILISAGTSLANWRNGADNTKIEGGSIAANTITANKLTIGSRGITVQDITFQTTGGNTLTWTAGVIFYVDDTGTLITKSISSGSTTLLAGPSYAYVYWAKGASSLSVGNSTTANSDPNVLMAVYQGGNSFTPLYGATIVDGSRITTGSITAVQIAAGTIVGDRIAANTITADNMVIGSRGGNSVLNANGASGVQGWALGETANAGGTLSTTSNFSTTGRTGFIITKGSVPNDGAGFSAKAIPVVPGKTYVFRVWLYGTSATASGLYLRVMYMTSVPSTGYVTNANRTSYTDLLAGGAIPSTATFYEYTWTCPAGVTMASPAIYNWQVGPTQMLFSDVEFFEQGTSVTIKDGSITASKLSVTSLDAVSGVIGLLRTATSGQRMELESNQLRVYDSAGTMRVRLGIW